MLDLRIGDFGAARRLSAHGASAAIGQAGTLGYMAPEVMAQLPYALPADVWSFGVILYALLSGSMPFFHPDEAVERENVLKGQWTFDDPNWSDVSIEARALLRSMLAHPPHRRPSTPEPSRCGLDPDPSHHPDPNPDHHPVTPTSTGPQPSHHTL